MFILLNWVKYYTKEFAKALGIIGIGMIIILTIIIIKYRPAYEVKISDDVFGYVDNKEKIELDIESFMNETTGNVAFKEQKIIPQYELKLVNRDKKLQDEDVIALVEKTTITTYKTYAVVVDGQNQASVATEEEAKVIVDNMKADLNEEIELNVGIVEEYTTDLNLQSQEEANGILNTIKIAKVEEYNAAKEAERKAAEEEAKKKTISGKTITNVGTIAGISLARPVEGTITSRFGSRSSIRSSSHTGLDIATSSGTAVTPIAPGTVKFASYKGSYGNLVIVDHGNGIESYYAHCSAIYANVGDTVQQNTIISAVGSTGNSTGPHLHVEIRQNGTPLNPEDYLY